MLFRSVRAAVNDMGDAVEVGIALDRVHRPEMAWDMVILVAVISIIAIALHVLPDKNIKGAGRFALFTVVGFVMMLVVYRNGWHCKSCFLACCPRHIVTWAAKP